MVQRLAVAVLFGLLAAGSSAGAAVIYVNAAAAGARSDGTSWANAYTSLQSALTAAVSSDEIWVVAGTYRPTGTTSRGISFAPQERSSGSRRLSGTETAREQRNPAANVTILSGDIGAPGNSSDNSYHVVTADSTVTASAVLDGFKITGGYANGATPDDRGAGLLGSDASPTVAHCVFTGNGASKSRRGFPRGRRERRLPGLHVHGQLGGPGRRRRLGRRRDFPDADAMSDSKQHGLRHDARGRHRRHEQCRGRGQPDRAESQQRRRLLGGRQHPDEHDRTGHALYGVVVYAGTSTSANSILWGDATGEVLWGRVSQRQLQRPSGRRLDRRRKHQRRSAFRQSGRGQLDARRGVPRRGLGQTTKRRRSA